MAVGDEMVEREGSISSLLIDSLMSSEGGDPLSPEDAAWVDSCLVKSLDISDTMAFGDEMVEPEGSISSLLIDSLKSSEGGDPLSPEDAAWVDSYLVKNLDISDSEWGSLKDAFLAITSVHVEPQDSSFGSETNAFRRGDVEMVPSSDGGIEQSCGSTDTEYGSTNEDVLSPQYFQGQPSEISLSEVFLPTYKEEDDNPQDFQGKLSEISLINVFLPTYKEEDDNPQDFQGELSEISLSNVFLPTYKEEDDSARITDMVDHFDSGLQISFKAHAEVESSTKDIFRVWDLSIPAEEDELVKQLEKALSETSLPSMPSEFDDSGSWKDRKVEPLDDLIAGISDLSLNQQYP